MKPQTKQSGNTFITTFPNISSFYNYIKNTPTNEAYEGKEGSKDYEGEKNPWSGTATYEEAEDLLFGGYEVGSKLLSEKLNIKLNDNETKLIKQITSDVVGYQAIVPNYLMGIPQNMVNSKMVAKKQKVITVNKSISYVSSTKADLIIENSVKALKIVKALESQGYAVNLNIVFFVRYSEQHQKELVKVRIKNSNERLNVSKLAFPLIHPAMIRRLIFRYMEVSDTVLKYEDGYGYVISESETKEFLKSQKEYFIPKFINDAEINDVTSELFNLR